MFAVAHWNRVSHCGARLIVCSLSSLALASRGSLCSLGLCLFFVKTDMAAPVVTPERLLSAFGPCGLKTKHTVRCLTFSASFSSP